MIEIARAEINDISHLRVAKGDVGSKLPMPVQWWQSSTDSSCTLPCKQQDYRFQHWTAWRLTIIIIIGCERTQAMLPCPPLTMSPAMCNRTNRKPVSNTSTYRRNRWEIICHRVVKEHRAYCRRGFVQCRDTCGLREINESSGSEICLERCREEKYSQESVERQSRASRVAPRDTPRDNVTVMMTTRLRMQLLRAAKRLIVLATFRQSCNLSIIIVEQSDDDLE